MWVKAQSFVPKGRYMIKGTRWESVEDKEVHAKLYKGALDLKIWNIYHELRHLFSESQNLMFPLYSWAHFLCFLHAFCSLLSSISFLLSMFPLYSWPPFLFPLCFFFTSELIFFQYRNIFFSSKFLSIQFCKILYYCSVTWHAKPGIQRTYKEAWSGKI